MKQSAGLLIYKIVASTPQVLLLHPSGPLYAKKDIWSIPKGELEEGEDHLTAAYREFKEELGIEPPKGTPYDLGFSKQKSGKLDYIWVLEGDITIEELPHDTFTMEWPPRSGKMQEFLENDRAEWFSPAVARTKVFASQRVFIDRFIEKLQDDYPEVDIKGSEPQPTLF